MYNFFQTIYDQEMEGQPMNVQEKVPFAMARKAMRDFRLRRIPTSPDSMEELCTKLQAGNYPPAYQSLYQGHVSWDMPLPRKKGRRGTSAPALARAKVKQWAVIFGDADLIRNVTDEATFYFADATFRCTPRAPRVLSLRSSQVNSNKYCNKRST